jgi:hypothetical protein
LTFTPAARLLMTNRASGHAERVAALALIFF